MKIDIKKLKDIDLKKIDLEKALTKKIEKNKDPYSKQKTIQLLIVKRLGLEYKQA